MAEKIRNLKELPNICPECGKPAIMWCRCFMSHSSCENGHNWHLSIRKTKEIKEDGRVHVVDTWYERELD